jgi:hypothetical protein
MAFAQSFSRSETAPTKANQPQRQSASQQASKPASQQAKAATGKPSKSVTKNLQKPG